MFPFQLFYQNATNENISKFKNLHSFDDNDQNKGTKPNYPANLYITSYLDGIQ